MNPLTQLKKLRILPILLALGGFTVALALQASSRPNPGSAIVGLWHVQYHGDFEGIEAFDQWHSDGQEFESSNEGLGVLCQGTWEAVGRFGVKQFHTWWSFDPATGQLDGYWRQNQTLTVSLDGQSYDGTFLVRKYDLDGNRLDEFTGTLHADRLTVDTPLP
jgi:hypothetical protein